MKKILNLFVSASLLSLVACGNLSETDCLNVSLGDFKESLELKAENLELDSIWKPDRIFCDDAFLLISDKTCKEHVTVFDISNGEILSNNVPNGAGPGESLISWSLQKFGDNIYSYDPMQKKLWEYKYDDFVTRSHISPLGSVEFDDNCIYVVKTKLNQFVTITLSDSDNLLTKFDDKGHKLNDVVTPFPDVVKTNFSEDSNLKGVYTARLYYSDVNDKIIVTYDYIDLFDIYDSSLNLQNRVYGPFHLQPDVQCEGAACYLSDDSKYAYEGCFMTSDKIYMLYSGLTDDEEDEQFPNQILVFDFNGNPISHYTLDVPVYGMCVSEKNKSIYGLAQNPECCVVKFKYE